jgi:hypothetical protein
MYRSKSGIEKWGQVEEVRGMDDQRGGVYPDQRTHAFRNCQGLGSSASFDLIRKVVVSIFIFDRQGENLHITDFLNASRLKIRASKVNPHRTIT